MYRSKGCLLTAGVLLAAAVAGCSSSSDGSAPKTLQGNWSGPWERTDTAVGGGEYVLSLQQKGDSLSGGLSATGSSCLTNEQVSGTVHGTAIEFHVVQARATATYTGTVSGRSMSGTGTVTCSAGTGTVKWKLDKR
jgi:hypothetical protein